MTTTTSENRTLEFLNIIKSLPSDHNNKSFSHQRTPIPSSLSYSNNNNSNNNNNNNNNNTNTNTGFKSSSVTAELRTFHQQASEISKDITSTSTLLSELTYALRHKSLLDDEYESIKMDALVIRIKQSIENLNVRLETAHHTIQQQKRTTLGNNSQIGQEATNVVLGLQSEFAETAADFKKVLQQRTDTYKETEDMQRQIYSTTATMNGFGGGGGGGGVDNINNNKNDGMMEDIPDMTQRPLMSEPPPVFGNNNNINGMNSHAFPTLDLTSSLMTTGEPTGSGGIGSLPRPHGIGGGGGGGGGGGMLLDTTGGTNSFYSQSYSGQYNPYGAGGNASLLTPLDIQRMEQEQGNQQMLQLIPEQSYLQSRADAMSTVESNIVELGTIFQKLAGLVHEHREMVQRVEDNVDDANANIFQSMNVLTDTLNNLRSNRALAMRLFSILVVFIIGFIVFFA